ncbi:DNA damage checkpoint control protein [Balamuthia mandrillaris]
MRFMAKLTNVNLFIKLVQTIDKIGKSCVVHLTPKKVEFILTSDITDGVQVWSGINSSSLFDEYRIESKNQNEIAFELSLDNLLRGLKSGQLASDITLKLAKFDGQPTLCIAVKIQSQQQMMSVVQDIPVKLLTAAQLQQFIEPYLPDPEVYIMLPPLKLMRSVIDRMKNIHDYLIITANMAGDLTLKVETELVSIATFYRQLEHPQIEGRSPPRHDPSKSAEVKVDIKKFARFLYSYQVGPTNVILCLVVDKAVVLHVLLEDLYLTYYIPVVLS